MQISKKNDFIKFIIKTFAVFLSVILLSQICSVVSNKFLSDGFFYSHKDKMNTLKSIEGTKTVFVGGSSVLFGVSAEQYEKLSGKPAINMGLNAGPYDIYFNEITPYINSGDTVVLALEFEAYTADWIVIDNIFLDLANVTENYHKSIPLKYKPEYYFKQWVKNYNRIYTVVTSFTSGDTFYQRSSVNNYGDIKTELISGEYSPQPRNVVTSANTKSLNELLKYINILEEKGAVVYIVYPPCFVEKETDFSDLEKSIRNTFKNRVLGNINDWVFETDENFLDTGYHLNAPSITEHTKYYFNLIENSRN